MRVALRSGAMLLVMAVFVAGCNDSGSPAKKTSSAPPASSSGASSTPNAVEGPNVDAKKTAAEPDYVVTVSGMA